MNTHTNRTQEKKGQAAANNLLSPQGSTKPNFRIINIRKGAVSQRKIQTAIHNSPRVHAVQQLQRRLKSTMLLPIQLMKKWTLAGGFEDIAEAPSEGWLRFKYGTEELYISEADMASFPDWPAIDTYEDDLVAKVEPQSMQEQVRDEVRDEFPSFAAGEVTSITTIKESKGDHQYVIAMVKGGPNIKLHYGSSGGLIDQRDDIDNAHGIPVSQHDFPQGLTGAKVIQIFHNTKALIEKKFTGGNCGGLASELVIALGATNKEEDIF